MLFNTIQITLPSQRVSTEALKRNLNIFNIKQVQLDKSHAFVEFENQKELESFLFTNANFNIRGLNNAHYQVVNPSTEWRFSPEQSYKVNDLPEEKEETDAGSQENNSDKKSEKDSEKKEEREVLEKEDSVAMLHEALRIQKEKQQQWRRSQQEKQKPESEIQLPNQKALFDKIKEFGMSIPEQIPPMIQKLKQNTGPIYDQIAPIMQKVKRNIEPISDQIAPMMQKLKRNVEPISNQITPMVEKLKRQAEPISDQIAPMMEKLKRNTEQAKVYAQNEINRGLQVCENYVNKPEFDNVKVMARENGVTVLLILIAFIVLLL